MNEITPEMKAQLTRAMDLLFDCVKDYIFFEKEEDSRVAEALLLLQMFKNDLDPR